MSKFATQMILAALAGMGAQSTVVPVDDVQWAMKLGKKPTKRRSQSRVYAEPTPAKKPHNQRNKKGKP